MKWSWIRNKEGPLGMWQNWLWQFAIWQNMTNNYATLEGTPADSYKAYSDGHKRARKHDSRNICFIAKLWAANNYKQEEGHKWYRSSKASRMAHICFAVDDRGYQSVCTAILQCFVSVVNVVCEMWPDEDSYTRRRTWKSARSTVIWKKPADPFFSCDNH